MNPARAALEWIARSPRRAFLVLFVLALGVRLFMLVKMVSPEWIQPHMRWEQQGIAWSLATTGRFADPYALPTGPTAHLPPLWPAIIALVYRVFGLGLAGGYAAWGLGFACHAAMAAMIPWVGGRLGIAPAAGVLAGIVAAFLVRLPGHAEAPTAIAMGLLAVAMHRRWTSDRLAGRASLLLGLAWGVAFHVQPALLPVLAGYLIFEIARARLRRRWRPAVVLVLGVLIACAPWGWRNWRALHDVFFIRSNLGLELRMAYHDGAAASMDVMDRKGEHRHPRVHRGEALLVQELGEAAYMRQAGREALEWMRSHPVETLRLAGARFLHVWLGPLERPRIALLVSALTLLAALGVRRVWPALSAPQRAALLIPLATYPLIYYVVAYMPRYRVPIDWLLLLLAAAEVWRWIGGPSRVRA